MTLDVYNTHMQLSPYNLHDYPILEKMYIATASFTQQEFACGYMIEDGKLYLPRGTPVSKVEHLTGVKAVYKQSDAWDKMSRKFYPVYKPRDQLQKDSIEFLTQESNPQLGLNLKTGLGKTFVCAYASTELMDKTIVITPHTGLKTQWIDTYFKMFDYRSKHMINIESGNIMNAIMDDSIGHMYEADVYFVNHATLRNFMTERGGYMLHKFFKKIKVGIKIYDEAHMEFSNILLIDKFSNVNRTWYLTATFGRSDKTEMKCYQRAFNSVTTFGEVESQQAVEKHVIYHIANINSRISVLDRGQVMSWSGMTTISYGKYAFQRDLNQTAYNAIRYLLNLLENVEGKILIFVPLIEVVDDIVNKLRRIQDKSVAAYHSKIPKDEKEDALKKDIIVSTIKSCGTGKDIKGLRALICCEPIASKILAEQLVGRLRPYAKDKPTYFFDVVDISIPSCNWWLRARMNKIETLVKEVIYLNLDK